MYLLHTLCYFQMCIISLQAILMTHILLDLILLADQVSGEEKQTYNHSCPCGTVDQQRTGTKSSHGHDIRPKACASQREECHQRQRPAAQPGIDRQTSRQRRMW